MTVENLKKRMLEIPWLKRCGEEIELPIERDVLRIQDKEAIGKLSAKWEDVNLEASNDLHVYLQKRRALAPQEWNKAVRAFREFIGSEVKPVVLARYEEIGISPDEIARIEWSLRGALLEAHFSKHRPPRFFEDVLAIMEAGQLPCGWQGQWPAGQLIVY